MTVSIATLALLVSLLVGTCAAADSREETRRAQGQALLGEIQAALQRGSGVAPSEAVCNLTPPESGAHRAHGKNPYDFTRYLSLQNSRIAYRLKYWMNTTTPAGGDPVAIEGSTGLGMERPSNVNWYANNFFEFAYGGKPILKAALADFQVVESEGEAARARALWDTPEARVVLDIALGRDDRHLALHCTVTARTTPEEVTLGFRAYPGRTSKPRDRRAATVTRELRAPQRLPLPPEESALVLFDEHEPTSCCAIAFPNAGHDGASLDLGEYGVTVHLHYQPKQTIRTGPIHLWDFRGGSRNEAMGIVFAGTSP